MAKYLFSRLMLVFLTNFFTSWAFNTYNQLGYFFGIGQTGLFPTGSDWCLTVAILVLGLITTTGVFLLLNLKYDSGFFESVKDKGMIKCATIFFKDFIGIFKDLFNAEFYGELYPKQFLVFAFIFLSFIKGNPLINIYHGIAKEYYIEGQGRYANETRFEESHDYILHNSEIALINQRMDELEGELSDDEPFYKVKKRGYLFIQSGLIEGYQSPDYEYVGFWPYFGCLFFLAIEKFINAILYFMLPFVISIAIYHYKGK